METFSALLAICVGNSPVPGEFPGQRPVTRSVDVFFDLRLNKRLSKQSWGWWFETLSRPLWRHCNVYAFIPWGQNKMADIVPDEILKGNFFKENCVVLFKLDCGLLPNIQGAMAPIRGQTGHNPKQYWQRFLMSYVATSPPWIDFEDIEIMLETGNHSLQ